MAPKKWLSKAVSIALVGWAGVLACSGGGAARDGAMPDRSGDGLQFRDVGPAKDGSVDLGVDLLLADLSVDLPAPDLAPPPDLRSDVFDACVPSCQLLNGCGSDGCGGSCGSCGSAQQCVVDHCVDRALDLAIGGVPQLVWKYKVANYCAIPDGPVRMYRDAAGRAAAIIAHANNYRVVSSTTDGELAIAAFVDPLPIYESPQNWIESIYDSRIWVAALWTSDGTTIRALGHHEWHPQSLYYLEQPHNCVMEQPAAYGWVNAVHHLTSTDGGASFNPTKAVTMPFSNQSDRLALAPEPWSNSGVTKPVFPLGEVRYGFFRPSNIAEEGGFYYVAVAVEELVRYAPGGSFAIPYRRGFTLVRTSDLSGGWSNGKWQRFDGASWVGIGGAVENGQAHLFAHDAAQPAPRTVLKFASAALAGDLFNMTHSLTRSTVGDRWLLLGHTSASTRVAYVTTSSLAQPVWSEVRAVTGSNQLKLDAALHPWPVDDGGTPVSEWAGSYPSVVDHQSAGRVFAFSGAAPRLYYVKTNQGVDRDIYRVELKVSLK